jgi:hypothetical protein
MNVPGVSARMGGRDGSAYALNVRRRVWLVLGVLAVAAGLGGWFLFVRDGGSSRSRGAELRGLDVVAFRAALAAKTQHAKEIVARPPVAPRAPSLDVVKDKWPTQGLGALPGLGRRLIEPQCTLGPRELCTSLAPLIDGCDGGDPLDCIAVGQFLEDTPPRPFFAQSFFAQACRIGDPAGCRRVDELKSDRGLPCERDPFACGLEALRSQDRNRLDESCSLGVAASCSYMAMFTTGDLEVSRAYLEAGCQLGEPAICQDLGHRLQPDCESTELAPCFPPDPSLARAALEIACAAGWEEPSVCQRLAAP